MGRYDLGIENIVANVIVERHFQVPAVDHHPHSSVLKSWELIDTSELLWPLISRSNCLLVAHEGRNSSTSIWTTHVMH